MCPSPGEGWLAFKQAMQGTWKVVVAEKNGEKRDRDDLEKVRVVFDGDKMTIKDPRLGTEEMICRLDPSKKPKQIDLSSTGAKEVNRGIYSVDDNELKVCWADPDEKRPTEFSAKAKSGWTLLVLKRVKP
jgi:uncharacterized protein (TIGR03067 family)